MVDVGRTAFTSFMRLHANDPGRLTAVRWYRVPWSTPTLGLATFATSSVWDERPADPPLGELASSREWADGAPPPDPPPPDAVPTGTPEEWEHGLAS